MSRADASLGVGGALVRPKAGFLCVLRVETGRRHDARLWLRGVAGLSIRDPCFERPPSRCRRALEGPVRVCIHSRRRSNRCTSGGARRAPRDVAAMACPLHGQVRQEPPGAPDGRVERLPPPRRGRRRRAGQLVRIGAGLRRGIDVTASRCFSWPVRSAPSVASKADTTLGCYSNSAFFFAVDPQVSSLSHSRKESLCGATRTQSVQEGAATRVHWQA